jgi:hypothetical protein
LATLIWVVESGKEQGRHPHLFVTNRTPSVEKPLEEYPTAEYGYTLDTLAATAHRKTINWRERRGTGCRRAAAHCRPAQETGNLLPIGLTPTEDEVMQTLLTDDQIRDFTNRGFSRRNFGRIAAMLSAGAAMPFLSEPALAQLSRTRGAIPADAVKIDANENPLGPCKEAA